METVRSLLLKASESRWLAEHLPNYPFARRAVRRFMPGEDADDALKECATLLERGIATVITRLGENISRAEEAEAVAAHYVDVLRSIDARGLPTHVSIKLTQLGLDIDATRTIEVVQELAGAANVQPLWIDMESSRYTQSTIDVFNAARAAHENVGLCVQSYLKRTTTDLEDLLKRTTAIRLVKGAYNEPAEIAFARKSDVDENFVTCARMMLEQARHSITGHVPAFATHDVAIIRRLSALADELGVARDGFEFQLLYGINTAEQQRLAREGFRVRVLISYGSAWFAWYMRRLAERPANVWFLMKSLVQ